MEKTVYKFITYEDEEGIPYKINYNEIDKKYEVVNYAYDDEGGYWERNENFEIKKHFSELAPILDEYAKEHNFEIRDIQVVD